MNKYDWLMIGIVFIISVAVIFIKSLPYSNAAKKAHVYYENKEVLTVPLTVPQNETYEVDGYNGKVKIEVVNGQIRVIQENSPLHLCSKQGFISEAYESIICLPNKIVINIEAEDKLDTIIE